MINLKRILKSRNARILAGSMLVALAAGCGGDSEDTSQANNGMGIDNIYVPLSQGIVHAGARNSAQVQVEPNADYNVQLSATNDGDSDLIDITADDKVIGSYVTDENRFGGNGWYVLQESQLCHLNTSNKFVTVGWKVSRADDWGVWPQSLRLTKVQPTQ